MHITIVAIESRGDMQPNISSRKLVVENCEQIGQEVLSV